MKTSNIETLDRARLIEKIIEGNISPDEWMEFYFVANNFLGRNQKIGKQVANAYKMMMEHIE